MSVCGLVAAESQLKGAVCYCRVLCHLGAMASSHSVGPVAKSVVLYGCMEKETLDAEAGSGAIPVDRLGSYVGLRTEPRSAFQRLKDVQPEVQTSDVLVFAVNFTPQGFLYCSTHMVGTIPLLERMRYDRSPIDWANTFFCDGLANTCTHMDVLPWRGKISPCPWLGMAWHGHGLGTCVKMSILRAKLSS